MPISQTLLLLILLAISRAALNTLDYEKYIRFHWKGNLQSHSIILKVFPYFDKLQKDKINTFLSLYTKSDNQVKDIKTFSLSFEVDEHPVTQVNITSLNPTTQYFYTFVFTKDIKLLEPDFLTYYAKHPQEFSFQTPEIALKPYNFTFGAASCADTGSTSPVFQNLTDENLSFFIHMGDLHYSDINTNDVNLFYQAYYNVFASHTQRQFFESTPIVYNWDDHDFGANDADGSAPSKPAVTKAYRNFVPYHPLKNTLPADDSLVFPDQAPVANKDPKAYLNYQTTTDFGIFRSFIIGRCLFIIMDLRSFQDGGSGDILGQEQKTWIENQLIFAGNNDGIKMVFMISSVPWIDVDRGALWENFDIEQAWIGKVIEQNLYANKKKIMLLAGDAHMTAFDDGRNNIHGGFPVVQAASLDRFPHCRGGPYSHGRHIDRGQYSVIQITDDAADQICVKIDLKKLGTNVISYDTCNPELYPLSDEQHCPSRFFIYLTLYKVYIIAGCGILGFIFAGAVYWSRYKKKQKPENNKSGNERYNLATEEQEIDDFNKSPTAKKNKKVQSQDYSEQNSEMDFQGAI